MVNGQTAVNGDRKGHAERGAPLATVGGCPSRKGFRMLPDLTGDVGQALRAWTDYAVAGTGQAPSPAALLFWTAVALELMRLRRARLRSL